MDDFNNVILAAGLDDMCTHACQFTWTNKQSDPDRKWMRLDRVLVNFASLLSFPNSFADALCSGVSSTPRLWLLCLLLLAGGRNCFISLTVGLRKSIFFRWWLKLESWRCLDVLCID
ncbi:hypothetical protein RND81_05G018800 [Saponaria officinalis]|uniref:Uncharacterized protein n=1 Tax=Saponaria officinalis TaxID=3572 RepID=A0AAW1KTL2_SAPOF